MMIRIADFTLALLGLLILLPIFLILIFLCYLDTGSPIFAQERVGKDSINFILYKFRTMDVSASSNYVIESDYLKITKLGSILRKFKFDEIPQLLNVLSGRMSLVGPRPCLPSQKKLIKLRKENGILEFKPGITGLAQIERVDMSKPEELTRLDMKMLKELNFKNYLLLISKTILGAGFGDSTFKI